MLLKLIKLLLLMIFIRRLTMCHINDVHASRVNSKKKILPPPSTKSIENDSALMESLKEQGVRLPKL